MKDLSIVYYTANRIGALFGSAVRGELLAATGTTWPIVSVSQAPLAFFGRNICVGALGASIWNCYHQILVGARAAMTPFVACCEDDSLYVPEHFTYRPPLDTFAYNTNRWVITRQLVVEGRRDAVFYWRQRTQMAQCIAPRELLIETLERRFAKWPTPITDADAKRLAWGEPGRYERNMGLPTVALELFQPVQPNVTFNHAASLMGRRRLNATDLIRTDLAPWGNATALWSRIHGD